MASVDVFTKDHVTALVNALVASGSIDSGGFLQFTLGDGTVVDVGQVTNSVVTDALVENAVINSNGHLILTLGDGVTTVDVGSLSPTGSITMFASATAPAGWLSCNGTAVSRSTYAALFSVIGTTYGVGDGSTTFNVPDMGSKFPRSDVANMGVSGGSATSPHTHTITAHLHTLSSAGQALVDIIGGSTYFKRITSIPSWTPTDTAALSSSGASGPLNGGTGLEGSTDSGGPTSTGSDATANLPPYLNVNFIIKT